MEVRLSAPDKMQRSNTGTVLPLLKGVCQKMTTLYSPLFQRKDEADRIRHVLVVLKRFNFLFTMPGVLQKNIQVFFFEFFLSATFLKGNLDEKI
jgi:hypothetical protein